MINNARQAVELVASEGSLGHYVWGFEASDGKTLAKDLKRRGWRFVGPTTVYAFMEAMGLLDTHIEGCDTRPRVDAARRAFDRP